ncbi:MAG: nitroreductase family protein [Anaerolineae bacterium]|nr:nitroreductase family protein [Anaerolineae bacterium]
MAHSAGFEALDFQCWPEETQLARSREFLAQMQTRRSVRDFSREPVPYELIENAIATAGRAPSGANQQPWTFVVVSEPALKQQIRQAAEAEEKESYTRRMSAEWLAALEPLGTDWHKPHLQDAPYLIVVFAQSWGVEPDSASGAATRIKHYYVAESVGIAVGLLLASLHLAGLATLTHTPSPMAFLSALLERPANEKPYVLIPVGYPAEGAQVPRITKNRWPASWCGAEDCPGSVRGREGDWR